MNLHHAAGFLPIALTGAGVAAFAWVLLSETAAFRAAVAVWAERDLAARTELAARALAEPLATGDFRALRAFGEECRSRDVRLTVLGAGGGMTFDTEARARGERLHCPEVAAAAAVGAGASLRTSETTGARMLYCARREGAFIVRLALSEARVFAPVARSRLGLVLAGCTGAAGLLLVFLFTRRLTRRVRELARERDEQTRRVEELRRAEDFRRAFVADVTHEIKTPLTGILGAVDLLSDADAASREELLALLRREASRLNSLALQILSLADLERDGAARTFAETDLGDVVACVRDRFAARARAAGVRFVVEAPSGVVVPADAALVEQALANLVENALRYSGSDIVEISLARTAGHAVLAVTDHGRGIAPEHAPHVFERFYRVDKARSRELGGSGLGLAIVKHVARLHGGDAALEPVPGGGCRFSVSFSSTPDT